MVVQGYIADMDAGHLYITAPFTDSWLVEKQGITECEIRLDDGRTISAEQRKKIYATLRDMSLYNGHTPDELKALLKYDYIAHTGAPYFSLSDCDMTTANEFLNFILEFCLEQDIPLGDTLLSRSPDVARAVYACLANKRCIVCGAKAELHHVDAVGAGRSRKEVIHTGMKCLPVCRIHHTEAHTIGRDTFCEKHHVFGVKLDKMLCKIWKVKGGVT